MLKKIGTLGFSKPLPRYAQILSVTRPIPNITISNQLFFFFSQLHFQNNNKNLLNQLNLINLTLSIRPNHFDIINSSWKLRWTFQLNTFAFSLIHYIETFHFRNLWNALSRYAFHATVRHLWLLLMVMVNMVPTLQVLACVTDVVVPAFGEEPAFVLNRASTWVFMLLLHCHNSFS